MLPGFLPTPGGRSFLGCALKGQSEKSQRQRSAVCCWHGGDAGGEFVSCPQTSHLLSRSLGFLLLVHWGQLSPAVMSLRAAEVQLQYSYAVLQTGAK